MGFTDVLNKVNNTRKATWTGAKGMFTYLLQPDNAVVSILSSNGIAGFKFHLPQTEQVKFESEITDHYTDENAAYQDNIALKPITITVTGLQGEYFYDLHPIENAISTVVTTISLVSQYIPKMSNITKQNKTAQATAVDAANSFISSGVEQNVTKRDFNAVQLWSTFQNLFKLKSAQTRAFMYFKALWEAKARFSVETTWYKFDNMVIQSLVPMRDNNADVTNFTITFKQLNFAEIGTKDIADMSRVEIDKQNLVKRIISKGKQKNV